MANARFVPTTLEALEISVNNNADNTARLFLKGSRWLLMFSLCLAGVEVGWLTMLLFVGEVGGNVKSSQGRKDRGHLWDFFMRNVGRMMQVFVGHFLSKEES